MTRERKTRAEREAGRAKRAGTRKPARTANERRLVQLEHKTKLAEEYNQRIKRVLRIDLRTLNRSKYPKAVIARWKQGRLKDHADARGSAGGGVSAAS